MSIKREFGNAVSISFNKGLREADEIFGLIIKKELTFYSDLIKLIKAQPGKEVVIVGENPDRRVPFKGANDVCNMDHVGLGEFLKESGFKERELKKLQNVKKLEKLCQEVNVKVNYSDIQNGNLKFDLSDLYLERENELLYPEFKS